MTPPARLQAAVEILDEVIRAARDDGPPADTLVTRYFKTRRYAGSKDRRAVRELVFRAIRRSGDRPVSGRSAILGLADDDETLSELFGEPRGPDRRQPEESAAPAGLIPDWLTAELSPLVTEQEWPALLERAPLDLRVNLIRGTREEVLNALPEARPTKLSPWGVRLPSETRVDDLSLFSTGLVEIQDEGSQLIALACAPKDPETILDLCAGAGGKALALAIQHDARAPRAGAHERARDEMLQRMESHRLLADLHQQRLALRALLERPDPFLDPHRRRVRHDHHARQRQRRQHRSVGGQHGRHVGTAGALPADGLVL